MISRTSRGHCPLLVLSFDKAQDRFFQERFGGAMARYEHPLSAILFGAPDESVSTRAQELFEEVDVGWVSEA
jgi:hypothetical protein